MKEFIHYGLVLLIISGITAGILSFANKTTYPIIAEREAIAQIEARKEVYKDAEVFDEEKKIEIEGYNFIPAFKNSKKIGYVVNGLGQGYGGAINFTLAFDLDGKIIGLKVLNAKETPGLGDKIFDNKWQNSWIGRDKNYEFQVGIDSFAGATISPRGVYTEMIKLLKLYKEKVMK